MAIYYFERKLLELELGSPQNIEVSWIMRKSQAMERNNKLECLLRLVMPIVCVLDEIFAIGKKWAITSWKNSAKTKHEENRSSYDPNIFFFEGKTMVHKMVLVLKAIHCVNSEELEVARRTVTLFSNS